MKKVGIKSLKTLYIGGAKKQFELVIGFLKEGQVPAWIYECYNELMNKKKGDFKGTVKSCLRPWFLWCLELINSQILLLIIFG